MRNSKQTAQLTALVSLLCVAVQVSSFEIVAWDKRKAFIDVDPDVKISDLKLKIRDRFETSIEDQRLVSFDELLDDKSSLSDYPLASEFIQLANPLTGEKGRIYARTLDSRNKIVIPLMVDANETVGQIIHSIAQQASSLTEDKIRLFFQGKELADKAKPIRHYKLFGECWLDIRTDGNKF